jgi:phenylpropionate dioxygenase-like ring-hydroxylating dioxygenase large terminal subunit
MELSPALRARNGTAAASPPAANQFPEYPLAWYLFGPVAALHRRPLTRRLLGRELVAFRTASGRLAVLEARCGHLGADLGRGCVVGEAIRCPYHHWEYGPDGACVHSPAQPERAPGVQQTCYPITERHGYLFFFNGPEPLFPLPFFPGEQPEDFVAADPLLFHGSFSWCMFAANTFDVQHWHGVHNRRLLGEPEVDSPHPLARRTRFRAQVVGRSLLDRLTRWFAGGEVEFSITNWGGTVMLVTASFRKVRSYGLIASQPQGPGLPLRVEVLVLARRSRWRLGRALLGPVALRVRRLFTRGFVGSEFEELAGIRYNPEGLIEADRSLLEYFHWAASLPREPRFDGCHSFLPSGERSGP